MNKIQDAFSVRQSLKYDEITSSQNIDINKTSEEKHLNLRKKKINEIINLKRLSYFPNEKNKINFDELNISPENQLNNEEFVKNMDLNFIKNNIFSEVIINIKYGLYLLRTCLSSNECEINSKNAIIISGFPEILKRLFYFLNFADQKIKFESSWILINFFVYNHQKDLTYELFQQKEIKDNFLEFFIYSEDTFFINAMWICGNIAADYHFMRLMFFEENLHEKIDGVLIDSLSDISLLEKLCWFLSLLAGGDLSNFQTQICKIIPNTIKILNELLNLRKTKNELIEKSFRSLLYFFSRISYLKYYVIDCLFSFGLHKILISILTIDNKCFNRTIWRIVGNLACSSDNHSYILISSGLDDIITSYLSQDFHQLEMKFLKEIIWLCSNLACGTVTQTNILIEKGIINRILKINSHFVESGILLENCSKSEKTDKLIVYRETIYAFTNAFEGLLDNKKRTILEECNVDLPKLLINALELFIHDESVVSKVLESIKVLILIDEDLDMMETDERIYLYREKFLNYGIQHYIQMFVNSHNDIIYKIASFLEEEFTNGIDSKENI